MIFKNITDGPKVLNTVAGPVTIAADGVSEDVELSAGELKSAKATGWFEEEAKASKAKPKADDAE